jgi:cysteine-rich repeat protein
MGEECDDGQDGDEDACTDACRRATCGDGIIWFGVEDCDDGNDENNDFCSNTCRSGAACLGSMACYPMDGDILDSSGNEHHGINYGAAMVADRRQAPAGALAFQDGAYVEIADDDRLDGFDAFSLCAWVRPLAQQERERFIVAEKGGSYRLAIEPSNQRPWISIATLEGQFRVDGNLPVSFGQWNQLCTVYDGNQVRLFVRGQNAGSAAASGTLRNNVAPLRIGGCGADEACLMRAFTGDLDAVLLWDEAISAQTRDAHGQ